MECELYNRKLTIADEVDPDGDIPITVTDADGSEALFYVNKKIRRKVFLHLLALELDGEAK